MALAVVFFTGIDTSAKWLNIVGIPVFQIVFMRYLGHFIYSLILYLPQEGLSALHANSPKKQILRSFFLFSGTYFNFQALKYLPISLTTTIMFASPIVITLLSIPLLKEQVGIRRILAVCVGFIGVVIVIQPWSAKFDFAIVFSLIALFLASMYFIMTRAIAGSEHNSTMQIWSSFISSLALFPMAWNVWIWPEDTTTWLVMLLIGAFGLIGHIFATMAHRISPASSLAPVIYTQIFWVTLVGVVIFQTWPTIWTITGGAVIIGSGLYILQRERAKARHRRNLKNHPRPI